MIRVSSFWLITNNPVAPPPVGNAGIVTHTQMRHWHCARSIAFVLLIEAARRLL